MKLNLKFASLALASVFALTACEKDVEEEDNDNEVITTLEVHLMERSTSNHLIYKFDDPDGFGSGSVTPVVDLIDLPANKVYDVELKLFNKTANPVEEVTGEIEEEAASHRFYIVPSTGSNITVSDYNTDGNGAPVGLASTWTTGAAATGTLRIVLRHYPDGGKATEDPIDSPKSGTDVDVTFSTAVR